MAKENKTRTLRGQLRKPATRENRNTKKYWRVSQTQIFGRCWHYDNVIETDVCSMVGPYRGLYVIGGVCRKEAGSPSTCIGTHRSFDSAWPQDRTQNVATGTGR